MHSPQHRQVAVLCSLVEQKSFARIRPRCPRTPGVQAVNCAGGGRASGVGHGGKEATSFQKWRSNPGSDRPGSGLRGGTASTVDAVRGPRTPPGRRTGPVRNRPYRPAAGPLPRRAGNCRTGPHSPYPGGGARDTAKAPHGAGPREWEGSLPIPRRSCRPGIPFRYRGPWLPLSGTTVRSARGPPPGMPGRNGPGQSAPPLAESHPLLRGGRPAGDTGHGSPGTRSTAGKSWARRGAARFPYVPFFRAPFSQKTTRRKRFRAQGSPEFRPARRPPGARPAPGAVGRGQRAGRPVQAIPHALPAQLTPHGPPSAPLGATGVMVQDHPGVRLDR